jgi:hypothetical protein
VNREIIICKPAVDAIYDGVANQRNYHVRLIMSATASLAIAGSERDRRSLEPLTDFWSRVSARFYRFFEQVPYGYEDVDPEVFKRVPVPI